MYEPGHNDEHVQTIPCFRQISLLANQTHRYHLDAHFDGEECKNGVVGDFEYITADSVTVGGVTARFEHPKCDTVEQYD